MPKTAFPGVYEVLSGMVHAYAIESIDGLVLIDTGYPKSAGKILAALAADGFPPYAVKHIVCTHAHPDHIGGLAELAEKTGAATWIHEIDAPVAETAALRPVHPTPSLKGYLIYAVAMVMTMFSGKLRGRRVDNTIREGEDLPFGLKAFHAPGHCAGQVVLLWEEQRLLFAADSCMNLNGVRLPLMNEDRSVALESLRKVSTLDFDAALFGHGAPIESGAQAKFREAVALESAG